MSSLTYGRMYVCTSFFSVCHFSVYFQTPLLLTHNYSFSPSIFKPLSSSLIIILFLPPPPPPHLSRISEYLSVSKSLLSTLAPHPPSLSLFKITTTSDYKTACLSICPIDGLTLSFFWLYVFPRVNLSVNLSSLHPPYPPPPPKKRGEKRIMPVFSTHSIAKYVGKEPTRS